MGIFSRLNSDEKKALKSLENVISSNRINLIKELLKEKKITLELETIETYMAGSVYFHKLTAK